MKNQASKFQEVHMIFDRFDEDSLKTMARRGSTKQFNIVYYKSTEFTRIVHCKTKECLASIYTNKELTGYWSGKLVEYLTMGCHCVKSVRIRSYSGQYSVQMWENTD